MSDMEECTFKDLPDGALFIELPAGGSECSSLEGEHDLHEKCGDHELALVGTVVNGVAHLNPRRGSPTPDHINGRARVIFVSRDRICRQVA